MNASLLLDPSFPSLSHLHAKCAVASGSTAEGAGEAQCEYGIEQGTLHLHYRNSDPLAAPTTIKSYVGYLLLDHFWAWLTVMMVQIEAIEPRKLLGRLWSILDTNQDGSLRHHPLTRVVYSSRLA